MEKEEQLEMKDFSGAQCYWAWMWLRSRELWTVWSLGICGTRQNVICSLRRGAEKKAKPYFVYIMPVAPCPAATAFSLALATPRRSSLICLCTSQCAQLKVFTLYSLTHFLD